MQRLPADAEAKCAANPNCEYTTYLKLKVLNQKNEIVFPRGSIQDIIPLIAVSDTITQIAPRTIITTDMFGGPPKLTPVSISGSIAIADFVLGPSFTSDRYYVVKATDIGTGSQKYYSCQVSGVTKDEEWNNQKMTEALNGCNTELGTDRRISLGGDSFIVFGTATPETGKTEASMGLKILKYSADTASCTSDVVKWKVISTLLGTETSEGVVRPSGQPVVYNGQPQEKTTEINVRCKPFVAGAGGTQALASLVATSGDTTAGGTRTVTVRFTDSVAPNTILSLLKLRVTKAGMVVYDGMPTVGAFASTNEPAHEYSATLTLDHDAGTYQICAGAVCSDTFEVTGTAPAPPAPPSAPQPAPSTGFNIKDFNSLFTVTPGRSNSGVNVITVQNINDPTAFLVCDTPDVKNCQNGLGGTYTEDFNELTYTLGVGSSNPYNYYVASADCQVYQTSEDRANSRNPMLKAGGTNELARLAFALNYAHRCGS